MNAVKPKVGKAAYRSQAAVIHLV